ncbi:MAG: cytochrome c biogenesis protein CcsA [Wolinella sp.]
MRLLLNLFLSYKFVLFMLLILGAAAGVATFLESIYDTQTAKILVYDARWYEIVMLCLTISLIGITIKGKMWRRFGAFVLHSAFIVIILGAFLTRYFGEEGVLHVREGESSNEMVSVKPFLQIFSGEELLEIPLNLAQVGNNNFKISKIINSKNFNVEFVSYEPAPQGERGRLVVNAGFEGEQKKELSLLGGAGWISDPATFEQNGEFIEIAWGSKIVKLPFSIELVKFKLERYAGSQSPSSYSSDVRVIDNDGNRLLEYKIFMNHPLTYNGAKFFQSSYDIDEMGTILEINRDPGKWVTYLGYFMLCVGFLGNFFTRGSRFEKLNKFIKNSQILLIFTILVGICPNLKADEISQMAEFNKFSARHANGAFAQLLVQDYMGRIKPLSTEAYEVVSKMSGQTSLFGLSPEQIILAMNINPSLWQNMKIIKIGNKQIKKLLNLPEDEKFVSFSFMFDQRGFYKLGREVDAANAMPASKRGTLENELIKFDERINIAYLTFKGIFFKFIPIPNDMENRWLSPNDAFMEDRLTNETKTLLNDYLIGLQEGMTANEWNRADRALEELKSFQRATSSHLLPSEFRIKTEVIYNKVLIFKKLASFYMLFGLGILTLALVALFSSQKFNLLKRFTFWIFVCGFLAHTIGLGVRWYISGHAPWSDSYESMIYIGWSAALAGMIFFRKSLLTLAAASLLAGVVMLVAHMSFVNPQITNLVPVLKSYWLTIHVSVITASYGFLGLGCLLAMLALLLMALKTERNLDRLNEQIRYLAAITEVSLIVGLCLLTLGNFFGGVWANESWGRYWGWDSKETWSFVSIVVYVLVLHMRFVKSLNSVYLFLVASAIAYSSIIMTYFGVNFYLTGMHSYAAGEMPSVPNFIYFIIVGVIALIALAYRGREVKAI